MTTHPASVPRLAPFRSFPPPIVQSYAPGIQAQDAPLQATQAEAADAHTGQNQGAHFPDAQSQDAQAQTNEDGLHK